MRFSDLLVWVEHDSEASTDSSWWEVLGELGSNETTVSVATDDLAPNGLVGLAGLGAVGSVDISDTLSVVPSSSGAILAALNFHEGLVFCLGSLTTLVSHENSLRVKSVREIQ